MMNASSALPRVSAVACLMGLSMASLHPSRMADDMSVVLNEDRSSRTSFARLIDGVLLAWQLALPSVILQAPEQQLAKCSRV